MRCRTLYEIQETKDENPLLLSSQRWPSFGGCFMESSSIRATTKCEPLRYYQQGNHEHRPLSGYSCLTISFRLRVCNIHLIVRVQ